VARRTPGQRYLPPSEAVQQARARGETNARTALQQFRRDGGSIRTQEWYRVWRNMPDAVERTDVPGTPPTTEQAGREPRAWITNVSVIYWDPRNDSVTRWWYGIKTNGPRRMPDRDALEQAISEGNDVARRYEWVPVYAYVVGYEAVY
jgi:hypothetical protein